MEKYFLNKLNNKLTLLKTGDKKEITEILNGIIIEKTKEFIELYPKKDQENKRNEVIKLILPKLLPEVVIELPEKETPWKELITCKNTDKNTAILGKRRYVLDKKTGDIYLQERFDSKGKDFEVLKTIALEIIMPAASFLLDNIGGHLVIEQIEQITEDLLDKVVKERLVFIELPAPRDNEVIWDSLK